MMQGRKKVFLILDFFLFNFYSFFFLVSVIVCMSTEGEKIFRVEIGPERWARLY